MTAHYHPELTLLRFLGYDPASSDSRHLNETSVSEDNS